MRLSLLMAVVLFALAGCDRRGEEAVNAARLKAAQEQKAEAVKQEARTAYKQRVQPIMDALLHVQAKMEAHAKYEEFRSALSDLYFAVNKVHPTLSGDDLGYQSLQTMLNARDGYEAAKSSWDKEREPFPLIYDRTLTPAEYQKKQFEYAQGQLKYVVQRVAHITEAGKLIRQAQYQLENGN